MTDPVDRRRRAARLGLIGRVVAGGAAIVLIVAVTFTVILRSAENQREARETLQMIEAGITDANALQTRVVDLQTGMRGYVITGQPRFLRPYNQALETIPEIERRLSQRVVERNRPLLRRIYRAIDSYSDDYVARQLAAFEQGIEQVAATIKSGEGLRRIARIRRMFNRFYAREAADADAAQDSADAAASRASLVSILGLILTPILIALVTLLVARSIVRPIRGMSGAAERLAVGDLTVRVEERGGAEVGVLARSFNSMAVELQRNRVELEERNTELEAFSYSVSHDLRAPLRSIDGFSQALVEDCSDAIDDQGLDYLRRIRGAAARMSEQIDDLLRLSRVSRSEVRREAVDVTALAREVVEEIADSEPDRQVQVRVEDGLRADADRQLLRIALENLIGNAWKFTARRESPRIEVAAEPGEGGQTYLVRDNGAGFDMEYADKLFGVFQRLHSINEFEGTGIGLATVQRIVTKHDGQIWAEAEVDRGAAFRFTLGQQSKEAQHGGEQHGDPPGGGQPGRRGPHDQGLEEQEHQQRDSRRPGWG